MARFGDPIYVPRIADRRAEESARADFYALIARMSLEEKAGQLSLMASAWGGGTAASMLEWYKDRLGAEARQHGDVWSNLMDEARSSPPGSCGQTSRRPGSDYRPGESSAGPSSGIVSGAAFARH